MTTIDEYPTNAARGEDHLRSVGQALVRFARVMSSDIDESASKDDADAADIFTGISRVPPRFAVLRVSSGSAGILIGTNLDAGQTATSSRTQARAGRVSDYGGKAG